MKHIIPPDITARNLARLYDTAARTLVPSDKAEETPERKPRAEDETDDDPKKAPDAAPAPPH